MKAAGRLRYVELLPGVDIQYAAAGFVNLGVPTGRADYVQQELQNQLGAHDTRLRNIARFAQERGTGVCFDGINVARSLALQAVTFSANARDVHFLRALGRERVAAIARVSSLGGPVHGEPSGRTRASGALAATLRLTL